MGLGMSSVSRGVQIVTQSPFDEDGWIVSWTSPVGLEVNVDPTSALQVDIEKSVTFNAPNQGVQITFTPDSSFTGTPASSFVIDNETVVNNTGAPITSFSLALLNKTSNPSQYATFVGVGKGQIWPTDNTAYFSTAKLTNGDTLLTYTGSQPNKTTSFWGDGNPNENPSKGAVGNDVLISAPVEADDAGFALKELIGSGSGSSGGSSGGGGGSSAVPMPAAVWLSLAGLAGLAVYGIARKLKHRPA